MNAFTTLDQADQARRLETLAANIDHAFWLVESGGADLQRWLGRVVQVAEQYAPVASAVIVEGDVSAIAREYALMQSTLREFLGVITGAAALVQSLRDQRNQALAELDVRPDTNALYDRFILALAQHGDLDTDAARRLAYILFSSDEDVMANDVVDGLDALTRFREAISDAVAELDTRKAER